MVRGHDVADTAALHDLAEADALGVVRARAHASAHIRVDGKPFGLDQDLARSGIRHRLGVHRPVFRRRHPFRVIGKEPAAVHHVLHVSAHFSGEAESCCCRLTGNKALPFALGEPGTSSGVKTAEESA